MFQLIIFCFLFNQFLRYCSLWFSAETTRYDGYNKHDRIEVLAFWAGRPPDRIATIALLAVGTSRSLFSFPLPLSYAAHRLHITFN